jgi:GTPase
MLFLDRAIIYVRAGKGGNGAISLRREKYIPKGGPDGGDGGKGGDVVIVGDDSVNTLMHLTHHPHYRAKNGGGGMGKSMHGGDGADVIIPVPLGTVVQDDASLQLVADINENGQRVIIARGGTGGFGNEHFKSATNQTPMEGTEGEPGEERTLRLELKLLADVGLVGLPNAGKSTMLRAVSRATPKVADYPFTTLSPHLGIAELPGDRRLVVADIPGLIEGAAGGAGLGHDFLRHIERTSVIVHVLDIAPLDDSDPAANYEVIRQELLEYAVELAEKPEVLVFNKIDLIAEDQRPERVKKLIASLRLPRDVNPILMSGATGQGVKEMLEACWSARGKKLEREKWSSDSAKV